MALSPKEMEDAIIKNLPSKTGKNINQWIIIARKKNISVRKDLIVALKASDGLGHFQAQVVATLTLSDKENSER